MTAAWLLPIVAPIVAAATGAIVADVLPNPQHALITVIVKTQLGDPFKGGDTSFGMRFQALNHIACMNFNRDKRDEFEALQLREVDQNMGRS